MFDRTDGAAGDLPADDIRSALSAAIASHDDESVGTERTTEFEPDVDESLEEGITAGATPARPEAQMPEVDSGPNPAEAEREQEEIAAPPVSAQSPPSNWK